VTPEPWNEGTPRPWALALVWAFSAMVVGCLGYSIATDFHDAVSGPATANAGAAEMRLCCD